MKQAHRVASYIASILLGGALLAAGPATAGADTAPAIADTAAQSQEIASTTPSPDFRVTITATSGGAGPAPTATAILSTYTQRDGQWQRQDSHLIDKPDSWFWYPLTGEHAVGQFTASDSGNHPISVQLLRTPATGYSQVFHFHVDNGHIIAD